MATPKPDSIIPKTFISYSWDDDAHKEWVKQLATRLRADGVDVTLDRWHSAPGDQISAFMERAVRQNDFVIAVCTPGFKEKSDGRGGGVGYEGDIMTAYAVTGGDQKKFIPVLRRGSWIEAAPTWLLGRIKIDLSSDPYSESEYEELLRTLHGAREEAPEIGPRPDFGDKKQSQATSGPPPVTPLAGSSTPKHQSSVTPIPFNLPPSLGRLFKGRAEWLERICTALQPAGERAVDASRVALWGMGGLGKSRLATEYAHTYAHEHSALLAVTATTPEELTISLANLTGVLKLPQASATDLDARYQAALDWLDHPTHRGWLLLVDNVDDRASFGAVEKLIGKLHHGCVILTGRIKDWPNYVTALALDFLSLDHAVEYLLEATSGKRVIDPAGPVADHAQAMILARHLGGLALALVQAAAAICKRVLSFADYLADWQGRRAELLDDPDFDPLRTGYPHTVAATCLTSYAQLSLSPASAWVFDALCWLAPDPIPERLVTRPWPPAALAILPPEQRAEVERNPRRLLLPLYDFCLAERPTGPHRCLSIHPLVQDVGRIRQRRDGSATARAALVLGLVEADFVRPDTIENLDLQLLPERRAIAPHVLAILGAADIPAPSPVVRSRLRRVLSELRQDEGRWSEAVAEARAAVADARTARSLQETPETRSALVEALSTLASTLKGHGAFPDALSAGKEAVTEAGSLVADDIANLAHQRNQAIAFGIVGRIKESQGHFAEALDDFTRSREIREELVNRDPENLAYKRDLSITLNNVGRIMEEQRDYDAALDVFTWSREIKKTLVERDRTNPAHLRDLSIALENVGRIREKQGYDTEALDDFTRSRDIWQELLVRGSGQPRPPVRPVDCAEQRGPDQPEARGLRGGAERLHAVAGDQGGAGGAGSGKPRPPARSLHRVRLCRPSGTAGRPARCGDCSPRAARQGAGPGTARPGLDPRLVTRRHSMDRRGAASGPGVATGGRKPRGELAGELCPGVDLFLYQGTLGLKQA